MNHYADNHLHLQDERLEGLREGVLDRARQAGVGLFVCNGTCEADWGAVRELGREADIVPCFGLHPWFVGERSDGWLETLEGLLVEVEGSGIGEIGLDRWVSPRDEAVQEEVFRGQLGLARKLERPVSIHCLRAWDWMMPILKEFAPLPRGFHLHGYGGPAKLIPELVEMGAYVSFAGSVLHPKRTKGLAAFKAVPIDRLLSESDAPDMCPPVAYRASELVDGDGKGMSQPGDVVLTMKGFEAARQEELAEAVWENSLRFWRKTSGC